MSEHLSTEQVKGFQLRSLSPAEIVATHSHLAVCRQCRLLLSASQSPEKALTGLLAEFVASPETEPEHLGYEQIVSFIDCSASEIDREIVETHMEICPECAAEFRELSALSASMSRRPAKAYSTPTRASFLKRLWAFWRLPGHLIPLQAAATAAIAGLVIWIAMGSLRSQVAGLNRRISELQQANQALERQASRAAETQTSLAELQNEHQALQQEYANDRAKLEDLKKEVSLVRQLRVRADRNPSPRGLVALKDNGRVLTVDAGGNLVEQTPLPPAYQEAVRTALAADRAETPSLIAALVGKPSGPIRSSTTGVAFALRGPVGTVIQSDRPTLRWSPLPGATNYTVAVYDSSFHPVARSQPLSGTEWTIPDALDRGRIYSWQVTAIRDGKEFQSPTTPAPEARFKVLEQAAAQELEKARQSYANSHLILGILYARAGLLDEAETEFQALAADNPESGSARKLVDNLRMLRPEQTRR
jgi:hypothetical protein